ncbi:YegP family protein [Streptacidiphilus sp. MAP5-3]|jgi:uncharacterized protein YegP (UPF0339 family)|uniref:YegP family protein n=1 Tax=unclassified Streptacidiphilus TaxID=2643834 RepID=UPI00351671A5
MPAHFEVWQAENNEWHWHLKADNGETVAEGQGYASQEEAKAGCEAVKRAAAEAHIVEAKAA